MTAPETYAKVQVPWKVKLSELENQDFDKVVTGPYFSTAFMGVDNDCTVAIYPNGCAFTTGDEYGIKPAVKIGKRPGEEEVHFGYSVSVASANGSGDKKLWCFGKSTSNSDIWWVSKENASVMTVAQLKKNYLLPGNFFQFFFDVEIGESPSFDVKKQLLEEKVTKKKIKSAEKFMQWLFSKMKENQYPYLNETITLVSEIDKSEHYCQLGLLIFHSPDYFEGLKKWNEIEGRKEARLNMTGDVIKEIQYYVFNGKVSDTWDKVDMAGLVDAAQMFRLEGLLAICEKEMTLNISEDNAIHYWHIATVYDLRIAKNVALTFIGYEMEVDSKDRHMICPTCKSELTTGKVDLVQSVYKFMKEMIRSNRVD